MPFRLDNTNTSVAPRFTLVVAECVCVEDSSKRGIGTFYSQVPNLHSTVPESVRDRLDDSYGADYLNFRYGLLQYVDHQKYRDRAFDMRFESPLDFSSQAEPKTEHIREYWLLEDLTDRGCPTTPQLIFGGSWRQGKKAWIPGGLVYFWITQPIPGQRLDTIWSTFTTEEKQLVTMEAYEAHYEASKYDILVLPCGRKHIYYDRSDSRITFTNIFNVTRDEFDGRRLTVAFFAQEFGLEAPEEDSKEEEKAEKKGKRKEDVEERQKGVVLPLRPRSSLPQPLRQPSHNPLQNITNRQQIQHQKK